jgi:membrane-associated phospholipid phosphatase
MRLRDITVVRANACLRCALLLASASSVSAFSPAIAQTSSSSTYAGDSTSVHTNRFGDYVSRRELILGGAAVLATGFLVPLDRPIQHSMQAEDLQDNRGLRHIAGAFGFSGGPGPFIIGGTLYLAGRGASSTRLTALGVHLTEGVLVAAAINGLLKGVSGRSLPNAAAGEPGAFSFGRGFHDGNGSFVSFPSGHTAASFAAAAVVTSEVTGWEPSAARVVGPVAYSAATLVAVSRLYQNVHWASDLPLGAAIGVLSGGTVVTWARRHPTNWIDRHLIDFTVAPEGRRMMLGASVPLNLGAR